MYTIGEVSAMFGLSISTLRYYDNEGFFPKMKRSGGIRQFDSFELETLGVVECLKKSGLSIKEIKQFISWCEEGAASYPLRHQLFSERRKAVESEIKNLEKVLALLKYKCWYYEQAIAQGNESGLHLPENMPPAIRKVFMLSRYEHLMPSVVPDDSELDELAQTVK